MTVVARGKIKVDARRALAKLRDHMLVDGHLYATEIARSAVALGATKLDIAWDADDVWISFDGTPLDIEAIARVRDHVLAGEGGDHRMDALRTLGIGVTAALGLEPSFVEVHANDGTSCKRVRFDRAYLAEEGEIPKPIAATAPSRLAGAGTHVHVHRKLGFDVLRRAVGGAAPREIGLLLDAARDAPLELVVQGSRMKPDGPAVVLRVDLDEPSATRAFLEILSTATDVRATTLLLERGIRLVRYAGVPVWDVADDTMPLRLLFDATKLPTNASRSDIRMDADVWTRARRQVPDAMQRAVEALQQHARGERVTIPGVEIVDPRPESHAHALEAIAATVALAVRSERPVADAARALLDRPLLRDAVGEPLALRRFAIARSEPIHVHSGPAPEPAFLAPWLGGIPWLRGTPIDRAFAGLPLAPAEARIAKAREGYQRRQRALEHPASKPALPPSPGYVLHETFAVTEGAFAGLEGSVALVRTEGPYRRSASLRAFVDERLLESVPLPAISLPVDIAVAWPGRVIARDTYDAVARNPDFERAILYALRVAAMAVALRLERRDPEMIRLATLAWLGATLALGDVRPSLEAVGPIANDAVWPTSEPGALVTLKAIVDYAEKTGAVCTAAPQTGRAVDGRPVIEPATATALSAFFPPKTVIVPYDAWLAIPAEAVTRELAKEAAMMPLFLQVSKGGVEGFLGALPGAVRTLHRGRLVGERKRSAPGFAVLEDPACVPKPGSHFTKGVELKRESLELLELVIERCTNDQLALSAVEPYLEEWKAIFHKRLAGARPGKSRALLERIDALPAAVAARKRAALRTRFLESQPWPKIDVAGAPNATHTVAEVGTATLFLDASHAPPPIAILVHGRFMAHREVGVPAIGWVDIVGEDLVADDWSALSERGIEWTTDALRAASMRLVRDMAGQPGFASDAAALRLCVATLRDESARVLLRDTLGRVRWPTVQGGERTVGLAESVPSGAQIYPAYERGSEHSPYDEPAIHLPATPLGNLRQSILDAIGVAPADVTDAIARLQERRMRGRGAPAPRLAGTPPHPRLRATLESLGVTSAEGEIELAEKMDIVCIGADGTSTIPFLAVPFGVRAVFRASDPGAALAEIASAAEKLVHAVAGTPMKLGDAPMPAFLNATIRALACTTALQNNASVRAKVFGDSRGALLSLAEMKTLGAVNVTFDPAHAHAGVGPAAVFLTAAERAMLGSALRMTDVTAAIHAERLGAERRAAPPRATFELTPDQRACCLFGFRLEGELEGEVGLLAPEWAAMRSIEVYAQRRRLTSASDHEGGWPTIAIVNDDRLTPTLAFDGIAKKDDLLGLWAQIRQAGARHVTGFLKPTKNSLGVIRLPFPFLANRTPCLGVFWLEHTWPETPSVEIMLPGATLVRAPMTSRGLLPIRGRAYVLGTIYELDAALGALFEHVRTKLGALPQAKTVAEYAWDLRMLGVLDDVDAKAELAKPQPDASLLRVVASRAPHLIVPRKPDVVVSSARAPKHVPPSESFLEGLSRTVVDLVRPEPPTPVDEDLQRAVHAMKLTGDPVTEIVPVKRGRPIRFEANSGRLVVNTQHPAIRALARHPARVFHLLTAAVSEINRELEPVTDAEELAVLRDLLQQ